MLSHPRVLLPTTAGARRGWCRIFTGRAAKLFVGIPVSDAGGAFTDVDASYKDLGTTTASNASLATEIVRRKFKHVAALAPLRRGLFKRNNPSARKLLYLETLATPLLTVPSGAWEPLGHDQERILVGAQDLRTAVCGQGHDKAIIRKAEKCVFLEIEKV